MRLSKTFTFNSADNVETNINSELCYKKQARMFTFSTAATKLASGY